MSDRPFDAAVAAGITERHGLAHFVLPHSLLLVSAPPPFGAAQPGTAPQRSVHSADVLFEHDSLVGACSPWLLFVFWSVQ